MISELFGLPAHPLLVHGAVVLVPVAAIAILATRWRSEWRRAYSLPIALLGIAGAVTAFLAQESGEPLEEKVERAARDVGERARLGDHPEQGEAAFIWALVFAIALVAFWAVDRYWLRLKLPKWSPWVAYAIVLIPAVFATIGIIAAGHSGAELVWKEVGTYRVGAQ